MENMMPNNIDAEYGTLGSMLIDPDAIDQVTGFLHAEDFYRDANRTIYEAILTLQLQHTKADYITITDELERQNKLDDVGGAWIYRCTDQSGADQWQYCVLCTHRGADGNFSPFDSGWRRDRPVGL